MCPCVRELRMKLFEDLFTILHRQNTLKQTQKTQVQDHRVLTYSPTAPLTHHGSLGVVLALPEMRLQLAEAQHGRAAEGTVVTAQQQLGQHVAHDAGHRLQLGQRELRTIHGARALLGDPLGDAGIAKGVLAVRGLWEATLGSAVSKVVQQYWQFFVSWKQKKNLQQQQQYCWVSCVTKLVSH